jgi:hypothetical protein
LAGPADVSVLTISDATFTPAYEMNRRKATNIRLPIAGVRDRGIACHYFDGGGGGFGVPVVS